MTKLDSYTLPELTAALEKRGLADLIGFWQMSPAERLALTTTLRAREVDCAIEIGTAQGGSLAVITNFAKHTYSLELLPTPAEQLRGRMSNVDFRVGDSRKTIPVVLEEIRRAKRDLDFVLVDGDHSREGVRLDIEAVLEWIPRRPMVILMHDSFNPDCRFGIRDVNWSSYPHVHVVDMDFVGGNTIAQPGGRFEMWAGLALALLLPEKRTGTLPFIERCGALFEQTYPYSVHAGTAPAVVHAAPAPAGWYESFASADESRLQRFLEGVSDNGDPEPAGFAHVRTRLAPLVAAWRARGARVAIYGAGTHTKALLGLVPEVFPLVTAFLDRQGEGTFLGRPRVAPSAFSPKVADVVVYSSPLHEASMYASLSNQPVEHVRLYA